MTKAEYIERYGIEKYEKKQAQCRKYNQDHKQEISEYWKQYNSTQVGRANHLLGKYRQSDNKCNRGECTLTAEWIINNIFTSKCVFCGESDWTKLGCDRIDNNLPHTEDNVQCCCGKCNNKRGVKSLEEFLEQTKTASII